MERWVVRANLAMVFEEERWLVRRVLVRHLASGCKPFKNPLPPQPSSVTEQVQPLPI